MALLQFEVKKVAGSSFFRFMLALAGVFMLLYYGYVYVQTERVEELMLNTENSLAMVEGEKRELEAAIETGEADGDDARTTGRLEQLQEGADLRHTELEAYRDRDWTTLLEMEIQEAEDRQMLRDDLRNYTSPNWPSPFTEDVHLEKTYWLRDHNIQPVFEIHMFQAITVYDQVFDAPEIEESVRSSHNKYSSSGVHYLNHLFGMVFGGAGAGFFLFLFGDMVTKEGIGRHGSIHLLQTQPLNRDMIYLSKFLVVSVLSVVLLLSITILGLLTGTLFDRFGDGNYPVLVYEAGEDFTFMAMGPFLLQSALLFFMVLLFTFSLLFFFSIVTKRTSLAVGLTLTAIFSGFYVSDPAAGFAPYIPFPYYAVPDVVTQELAVTGGSFVFSFSTGMLVLGGWSLIVLAIIYVLIKIQKM